MKFRRHRPERSPLLIWIRTRLPESGAAGARLRAGATRARAWIRRTPELLNRLPGGKAPWFGAAAAAAVFLLGYALAATVLFPAPIFARTTAVPQLLGAARDEASATVRSAGLQVGTVTAEPHRSADRGTVIWQDPPAEVGVPEGHAVNLVLSNGPRRIPVPDLGGYDVGLATALVEAAGLRIGRRETTQAPAPAGVVINSRPPAGATLLPGSELTLVVSIGAPTIRVPDLRGLTRDGADSALTDAGLALGTAMRRSSDEEPGIIIAQTPDPGTLSAPGTSVNVTVARRRN
jgi:serine/threonine-protein kinase